MRFSFHDLCIGTMISISGILGDSSRNTAEHRECMKSSLGSEASIVYVFSWMNFQRLDKRPNQPKQTKLTSMLADADHAEDAAGGCMA